MATSVLSMNLPRHGDWLMRVIFNHEADASDTYNVHPCVVTYVNEAHHWYQVWFPEYDIRECYNLPMFDHAILKGATYGGTPVVCIETGRVYPSIAACARDMHIDRTNITRHVNNDPGWSNCRGYHFMSIM